MSEWLSEHELEELLEAQTPGNRRQMGRLLDELRTLREQAGERERMAAEEIGG